MIANNDNSPDELNSSLPVLGGIKVSPSDYEPSLSVAIVGQPNGGKSSLFRILTKIHQEVGNYPGLTLDAKTGHYHEGDRRIEVIDLPGAYSFSANTPEERVARNFILLDRPEVVIVVVDATNFRRHLSLVLELLEMQLPLIICLNFMDVAKRRGIRFDCDKLSQLLKVPVVPFVATKGTGVTELRKAIIHVGDRHEHNSNWQIDYGPVLESVIDRMERALLTKAHLTEDFSARWLAVKLMENDRETRRIVEHHTHDDSWCELLDYADEEFNRFIEENKYSPKKAILEGRNRLAGQIDRVSRFQSDKTRGRFSDRIDHLVCHPLLGPIILLLVMIGTFQLTFQIADGWQWFPTFSTDPFTVHWTTPVGFLNYVFHVWLPEVIEKQLNLTDPMSMSFVRHGVLAGAGGVIQFVPVIFVMFTILALLEQSGYIARVAMIMDSFMRRFNLQGRSILPMVLAGGLSGGCAVPAIMAARSMPNPRQRILTILAIPMLNCGGKIPIYAMLVTVFFTAWQGMVMASLVFIAWAMALITALILGKTVLKGQNLPLLLEIPSYQIPPLRSVLGDSLRQSGEFLKKAGTVILFVNIFLWFLMSFPQANPEPGKNENNTVTQKQLESSYAAKIGRFLEPVSKLAGFDWKDNVAFLGGLAAKELIVSSMSTLYLAEGDTSSENGSNSNEQTANASSTALKAKLTGLPGWTPQKAFAMLLFVMLYAPCSGTLVSIYRVTGSFKWPVFSALYNTGVAFLLAMLAYHL